MMLGVSRWLLIAGCCTALHVINKKTFYKRHTEMQYYNRNGDTSNYNCLPAFIQYKYVRVPEFVDGAPTWTINAEATSDLCLPESCNSRATSDIASCDDYLEYHGFINMGSYWRRRTAKEVIYIVSKFEDNSDFESGNIIDKEFPRRMYTAGVAASACPDDKVHNGRMCVKSYSFG